MFHNNNFRYLVAVQELLTSVQKTEDSLRKLKQIRDKSTTTGPSSASGSQSVSDDDKIRLQIQQDLKYFTDKVLQSNNTRSLVCLCYYFMFALKVKKLGLELEEIPDIKELHSVVEKSLSTSK